ncbi:helix-turn-helix domain-containing protein [Halopenitus sp. H-Gu1]|uniref:helix-turn-helix domain-containing protein n=1 Tax=Halopenitus sp. H-Gu1 TaxID=3242697 RepID=UPI00359E724C
MTEHEESDDEASRTDRPREEIRKTREKLGEEADKAVREFDEGVVDLLSWLLETETRARIYVYLRENPNSTSEEIADGTGLYPSTVREALAELHEEETVDRRKRESEGAGNNPYEYEAIAPSELVRDVVGQVQSELNTVFNLDQRLGGKVTDEADDTTEPVQISVESEDSTDSEDADADEETERTDTDSDDPVDV